MMKIAVYLLLGTVICRCLKINGLLDILIWPFTLAIVAAVKILEWTEGKRPGN